VIVPRGNFAVGDVTEPRAGSSASGARWWSLGPELGRAEKGRWSSRCVPLRWSVRWSPP